MSATIDKQSVKDVQERLKEWAAWVNSVPGDRLGLPKSASFVTDRISGGGSSIGVDANERAEQIESIVCRMKNLRPTIHEAVVLWYVHEKEQVICAGICKCSVALFRDRVRLGEMFVLGALADIWGGRKSLIR
uniref:Phage antitermination protein Q n=1 Tax=Candidatus Kentrum sp. LFY TaxID=2126342 RepID=A0A450WC22_9GAMM|nr:MAG: Phage antitermination protein Q [Candidatus Kentron sp. LFY]